MLSDFGPTHASYMVTCMAMHISTWLTMATCIVAAIGPCIDPSGRRRRRVHGGMPGCIHSCNFGHMHRGMFAYMHWCMHNCRCMCMLRCIPRCMHIWPCGCMDRRLHGCMPQCISTHTCTFHRMHIGRFRYLFGRRLGPCSAACMVYVWP